MLVLAVAILMLIASELLLKTLVYTMSTQELENRLNEFPDQVSWLYAYATIVIIAILFSLAMRIISIILIPLSLATLFFS